MSSQGNNINLLKQPPFYGRTIKSRIKEFTNAKLLSELPFFEKPIKAKIKQLTTKKLLQEQPFYKQSIKKPRIKKLKNYELLRELPFYDDINISRKERTFKGYAETYKVEIINNKSLSDLLSVSKNSIKNLFDKLLREKEEILSNHKKQYLLINGCQAVKYELGTIREWSFLMPGNGAERNCPGCENCSSWNLRV